jgi:hypothetical protein
MCFRFLKTPLLFATLALFLTGFIVPSALALGVGDEYYEGVYEDGGVYEDDWYYDAYEEPYNDEWWEDDSWWEDNDYYSGYYGETDEDDWYFDTYDESGDEWWDIF